MSDARRAMIELLNRDQRYKLPAYQFIRDALTFAQEVLRIPELNRAQGLSGEAARHMTGQQLCEACRRYALEQYGMLAKIVLNNWGIFNTGDFGEIVYNLIAINQMRRSESDRREDFDDVFNFDDAFEPEFELLSPEQT
jgi:uncharacterized repeat protein (TIGR04138 family)